MRVTYLTRKEFSRREDARRDAVGAYRAQHGIEDKWPPELYELNSSFIPPGSLWECWWFFDHEAFNDANHPEHDGSLENYERGLEGRGILTPDYYRLHAHERSPLCVKCPSGSDWVVDQKSSNGPGWDVVTNGPPYEDLTCSPSIVVSGYHGFLRNGEFTPDLDHGQGPDGIPYWRLPRE